MELIQATNRIYYIPGSEETDRPFLYYIKGDKYSVAVDAGNSRAHVELFYDALRAAGLPLPEYTLVTHWHWDHSFGVPYVNGSTIGSELAREKLIEVARWQWNEQAMSAREASGEDIAFCNDCIRKEYPVLGDIRVETVTTGISAPAELDAGGIHVQLFPRDSLHSRDALFVYVPEEKALFMGDGDCRDLYNPACPVDTDRLASLRQFVQGIDFEHYLLGHSVPDTKSGALEYLDGLADEATRTTTKHKHK